MEYGIALKVNGVGSLDFKDGLGLHETKANAGHLFHEDVVESVCVYDETGKSHLYLKKNENGNCVKREELI